MEVAEQVVVINEGRIEQAGTPDDLYERPANAFVMGFVGPGEPARRDVGAPARHRGARGPTDGAIEALVERVARVGFEVRVEAVAGRRRRRCRSSSRATRPSSSSCAPARSSGCACTARASSRHECARARFREGRLRRPCRSRAGGASRRTRRPVKAEALGERAGHPGQVPGEHPAGSAPSGADREPPRSRRRLHARAARGGDRAGRRHPRDRRPAGRRRRPSARRSWTTTAAPSRCATSGSPCGPACGTCWRR